MKAARVKVLPMFTCLFLGLILVTVVPPSVAARQEADSLRSAMLGMWAYAGSPGTDANPVSGAEMKCWGARHFFVTKRDPDTNEVTYHHGGTYALNGTRYTEKVLYSTQADKSMVGQEYTFDIEVDGDTYIQRGIGNPYSQQWQRLTGREGIDVMAVSAKDDSGNPIIEIPDDASVEELFGLMNRVNRSGADVVVTDANRIRYLSITKKLVEILDRILAQATDDASIVRAANFRSQVFMELIDQDPDRDSQHREALQQQADNNNALIAMPAARILLMRQAFDAKSIDSNEAEDLRDKVLQLTKRSEINSDAIRLAESVGRVLASNGHGELAADLLKELADRAEASDNPQVQRIASSIRGIALRVNLVGNTIDITGRLASGDEIRWDDYRGKVVLIDFWASWCGPCVGEFPNIKKNLEHYRDAGFVVLGVNMDDQRKALDKAVEQYDIPWDNLFEGDDGMTGRDHPLAVRYGITGIPSTILVGRDGNVVTLSARGKGLDLNLAKLFPDVSSETSTDD